MTFSILFADFSSMYLFKSPVMYFSRCPCDFVLINEAINKIYQY